MIQSKLASVALACLLLGMPACGDAGMEDGIDPAVSGAAGEATQEEEVASTSQALAPPPFLPHNREYQRVVVGCLIVFQHGNFLGAAYSKIKTLTPGCTVRAAVTALQSGQIVGNSSGRAFSPGVWVQAQVNYANIIGSDFFVNGYDPVKYRAIP